MDIHIHKNEINCNSNTNDIWAVVMRSEMFNRFNFRWIAFKNSCWYQTGNVSHVQKKSKSASVSDMKWNEQEKSKQLYVNSSWQSAWSVVFFLNRMNLFHRSVGLWSGWCQHLILDKWCVEVELLVCKTRNLVFPNCIAQRRIKLVDLLMRGLLLF